MENNQDGLKAVLQEKDCVGVPANEEYQEYLVDYLLDENLAKYRRGRNGSVSTHGIITMIGWHYKLYHDAEKMNML